MKIPTLPPTSSLPRFITFEDCEKGQTAAKTGCTPQEGGGGKESNALDDFQSRAGSDAEAEMYIDIAPLTDPDKWAGYMDKFGYSAEEAENLRNEIAKEYEEEGKELARGQWETAEKSAFNGMQMAGENLHPVDPSTPSIDVAGGLEKAGEIFGGLENQYPEVKSLVQSGLISGIVSSKSTGMKATYNPSTGKIEISESLAPFVDDGLILHEVGHALEELAPEGWAMEKEWENDQPSASMKAALEDPSEKFAEAFVQIVAGDKSGFQKHAPGQSQAIQNILNRMKNR